MRYLEVTPNDVSHSRVAHFDGHHPPYPFNCHHSLVNLRHTCLSMVHKLRMTRLAYNQSLQKQPHYMLVQGHVYDAHTNETVRQAKGSWPIVGKQGLGPGGRLIWATLLKRKAG